MELTISIQYLKMRLNLREVLIFMGSLISHNGNIACACAHIFQKRTWGADFGACALNRANTVFAF